MKKSIRLLLLSLLTPLFLGSTFAFDLNSDEIAYLNSHNYAHGSFTDVGNYNLGEITDIGNGEVKNVCVIFSGFQGSPYGVFNILSYYNYAPNVSYVSINLESAKNMFLTCTATQYNNRWIWLSRGNTNFTYSADYYWLVDSSILINGYLGFDIQSLLENYNQCSSDLNQCDTSVQQCLIDKESLSGSLAICNSDKESLTNYNEALSTQLNECLNNQGTGSNLSGLILNNNSLFRYLDDSLLSLPINNNLFLPLGYQGALDSGNVLYIKAIDEDEPENYYITPEDKVSIIDILSYIFVFFLGIGIIFSLIKLFKKLFTH